MIKYKMVINYNNVFRLGMIAIFIFCANFTFADDAGNKKIDITIIKHAEISSAEILLCDLVLIEGKEVDTIEKLKSIYIGKAPLPSKTRRIDRHYITLRLKQNNINLDQIQFKGSIETEVVRGYNQITKEEIEKIVATELPGIIGIDNNKITIKDIRATSSLILPKGKYTHSIVPPQNEKYLGKLLFSVYFIAQDGFKKRVFVSANIEQFANVVVARWPLKRNHLLKDTDVELKKMNLGDAPSNCITDINEVLGNKLKSNINKGMVLRTDMINIPPLIQRKDIVLIVAESNNFKIVTLGESKEKGRKGDLIKVINLDSNNEVYARIIDSNSVKVEF